MATLNIGGKKVRVGDEFLRLTPEQQNAAVEEIAASIGGAQPSAAPSGQSSPPAGFKPGTREYADWAAQQARAGAALPQVSDPAFTETPSSLLDPFVQGTTFGFADEMRGAVQGGLAALQGGDFGSVYNQTVDESRNALNEERRVNPIGSLAAEVAGALPTSMVAGGQLAGRGANLGGRIVTGATVGAGQGLVYSAGASEASTAQGRALDGASGALVGGGIGAVVPAFGAAIGAGSRAVGQRVARGVNAITRPQQEAARQVGTAVNRDITANPAMTMSAADEALARQSGLPLINVDRGGETTRALARSVSNQSPEARAIIQRTVDDRFSSQAPRAVEFIKRLTGGAVDDIGYQQSLRDTARMMNKPRYDAAYSSPKAAAVWTPNIRQLMQSDLFRSAINAAESTGTDYAAVSGVKAVRNPFVFGEDGSIGLKQLATGGRALPSLQFWDQVKRNLDGMIGKAQRAGDNQTVSVLTQMKQRLVGELDSAVPEYQIARAGAASFFGAEDALDAGKKFVTQPRSIPEATAAFAKFTQAEKQAFATGYASELIDRIKSAGDRRNVIQQMFGSPASREMAELVFGKSKARQLEAFVRVEGLADQLRGAMGNSTTARQLMELGIGGGAGFALSGDWQGALAGAAVAKGGRYLGEKIDARVMEEVARLLTSDDPAALQRAVANATMSKQWMQAIDVMERALEAPARGGLISAVSQ